VFGGTNLERDAKIIQSSFIIPQRSVSYGRQEPSERGGVGGGGGGGGEGGGRGGGGAGGGGGVSGWGGGGGGGGVISPLSSKASRGGGSGRWRSRALENRIKTIILTAGKTLSSTWRGPIRRRRSRNASVAGQEVGGAVCGRSICAHFASGGLRHLESTDRTHVALANGSGMEGDDCRRSAAKTTGLSKGVGPHAPVPMVGQILVQGNMGEGIALRLAAAARPRCKSVTMAPRRFLGAGGRGATNRRVHESLTWPMWRAPVF